MITHTSPLYGLILVLSNLFILPALWIATRMGYAMDSLIVATVFTSSTLYHACDAEWFCLVPLTQHRIQDHYTSNALVAWILLCIVGVRFTERCSIFFVIMATYVLFASDPKRLDPPFFLVGTIVFFALYIAARALGFRRYPPRLDPADMTVAILLLLASYVFFVAGGDPENGLRYVIMHSLWHAVSMPAVYFVIESRSPDPPPPLMRFIHKVLRLNLLKGIGKKQSKKNAKRSGEREEEGPDLLLTCSKGKGLSSMKSKNLSATRNKKRNPPHHSSMMTDQQHDLFLDAIEQGRMNHSPLTQTPNHRYVTISNT